MNRHDFKVIKGGCNGPTDTCDKTFESAYVTDTRLMGVIGVHIHWILDSPTYYSDLHQFFYFDAEEFGLETYKSYMGTEALPLVLMEKAIIGGLGGLKIDLNQREACWLVQHFVAETKRLKAPMAEPSTEYQFILRESVTLTDQEMDVLIGKMCTKIKSNWQLVHYFHMRSFGHDAIGCSYLTAPGAELDTIAEPKPATLCKNTIEEFINPDGTVSYLSESLIESDSRYKLVTSDIIIKDGKVISAKRLSSFGVSSAEAAMLLSRPEYVTLFEVLAEPDQFEQAISEYTAGSLQTLHESGKLFLEFNRNNDHVNRRVFQLNEDVHGLYFVSDYGQLLLGAYSLEAIRDLEVRLGKSPLHLQIVPTAKYEFKDPVLYEFIQSGYEDFTEFLDTIRVQD